MGAVLALTTAMITVPAHAQCGFHIEPVARFSWYKSEGWPTPGVNDANSTVRLTLTRAGLPKITNGRGDGWPEGITVSELVHERYYHLVFPSAVFEEHGQRKRMQSAGFSLVTLLRWEMRGKPYAYSYSILSDTVACGFSMDLVDDVGDGKFRVMKSSDRATFTFPPVPAWASKPRS